MSFGDSTGYRTKVTTMSEINVVPLVDVMLVLLVIFIITAPLLTHSVKIDLPKAESAPTASKSKHIEFAIRADGSFFIDGEEIKLDQLSAHFSQTVKQSPETELHIRADREAQYELVAKVMSIAASTGLSRIGFITDPTEQTQP